MIKRYFKKFLIIILYLVSTRISKANSMVLEKNLPFNVDIVQKGGKNFEKIGIMPFILSDNNTTDIILGASLSFTSKPLDKFLFGASVNFGAEISSGNINSYYKSAMLNIIYNLDRKSFLNNNVILSIFHDNDYYSFSIEQAYNYKITSGLLYSLGYDYFHNSDLKNSKNYNTIRLFTDINYNIAKLLFKNNNIFRINIGSKLFYDFLDNAGLTTNYSFLNSFKLETGRNIGSNSFGILFYFIVGL